MPNMVKISLFYKIFNFLTSFGMKYKKTANIRKNKKLNIQVDVLSQ